MVTTKKNNKGNQWRSHYSEDIKERGCCLFSEGKKYLEIADIIKVENPKLKKPSYAVVYKWTAKLRKALKAEHGEAETVETKEPKTDLEKESTSTLRIAKKLEREVDKILKDSNEKKRVVDPVTGRLKRNKQGKLLRVTQTKLTPNQLNTLAATIEKTAYIKTNILKKTGSFKDVQIIINEVTGFTDDDYNAENREDVSLNDDSISDKDKKAQAKITAPVQ